MVSRIQTPWTASSSQPDTSTADQASTWHDSLLSFYSTARNSIVSGLFPATKRSSRSRLERRDWSEESFRDHQSLRHRPSVSLVDNNPYHLIRGHNLERVGGVSVDAVRSVLANVLDQENHQQNAEKLDQDRFADEQKSVRRRPTFFRPPVVSDIEAASQLSEGTLRALRDLALDEAVELNRSLLYWNTRWERPLLSWLEAGPNVWFSNDGYNHQDVGKRVSQLQAVLVRRCAAIGELQEHLLHAGWQRGVAQWGFLGHGGQWAAVVGFDGPGDTSSLTSRAYKHQVNTEDIAYGTRSVGMSVDDSLQTSGTSKQKEQDSKANLIVRKRDGGGIEVDEPSCLVEWSVEALSLVRQHLIRSSNGSIVLPHQHNWDVGDLPIWASRASSETTLIPEESSVVESTANSRLVISNLPALVNEVEDTLDVIEDVMQMQRERRLEKLKPPSWIARNWYIFATLVPSVGSLGVYLMRQGRGKSFLRTVAHSIYSFFREHLRDPIRSIANEFMKGHEDLSNMKARRDALEALKNMIRNWLGDTFPDMPEATRVQMADSVDLSLLEVKKAECMNSFLELSKIARMSIIEVQYMKVEMMKALYALDEMMSANDMNMNIAAITPVFIVAYTVTRVFRFLVYALLKIGKSREETYESIRKTLLDIERLLVMRHGSHAPALVEGDRRPAALLCSDDLGMLMLLVHECRTTLWQNQRRFSSYTVQSVSEDLAELAGERGAISIHQQLLVVSRMCRTYPFLKMDEHF